MVSAILFTAKRCDPWMPVDGVYYGQPAHDTSMQVIQYIKFCGKYEAQSGMLQRRAVLVTDIECNVTHKDREQIKTLLVATC